MASYNAHSAFDAVAVSASASAIRGDGAPVRGFYIGGAGNVTLTMVSGNSVEFVGLPTGLILPVQATHMTAATATDVIALI